MEEMDKLKLNYWLGVAIALSGQLAGLVGVRAIEEPDKDIWTWVLISMCVFGLVAFLVGFSMVMGWTEIGSRTNPPEEETE